MLGDDWMSLIIIAEIGINHNGDLDITKQLIDVAKFAGADAVKFQKRTLELVYGEEELATPRESPFGTTNGDLKRRLEFGKAEYDEIDSYCQEKNIDWFASAWDVPSQHFLRSYDLKYNKIASAMITYPELLEAVAEEKRHTFISTGMSTMEDIERAVEIFRRHDCPFELMHTISTYPMPDELANLHMIKTLRSRFDCDVGYSGHEGGLAVSYAAAALGVTSIERHITINRAMFGSDQAASVEPIGFLQLCGAVRKIQGALGDGVKTYAEGEPAIAQKLRWFERDAPPLAAAVKG
jgi:N-acetylneuraminate synthase